MADNPTAPIVRCWSKQGTALNFGPGTVCNATLGLHRSGASMSGQNDKAKKITARYTAMMGGIGTAVAIGHIALIGSFPILEFAGLALGLVALVGGLIMMLQA